MTDFSVSGNAKARFHFDVDYRRPNAPCDFTMLWDETGEYGQIMPRPSLADIPDFYAIEGYRPYQETGPQQQEAAPHSPQTDGFLQKVVVKLAWLFDHSQEIDAAWWSKRLGSTPADVLEIGCARGAKLRKVADLGHRCVGIEPDERALVLAREKGMEIYQGTAEAIPADLKDRRFDCIIMTHVLEHCTDPLLSLQNAAALLKETGIIVVETPNNNCALLQFFGRTWVSLDVPRHLNFFTSKSLNKVLETAPFTVQDTEFRGYCRNFTRQSIDLQAGIRKTMGARFRMGNLAWYYILFLRTFWLGKDAKYDSVRVVARRR